MYQVEIPTSALNPRSLPPICPVTGATEELEVRQVEFNWHPRWVYLLLLVGIVAAVIASALTTKRARGEMLFGDGVWWRWTLLQGLLVLIGFAAIAGVIFGVVLMGSNGPVLGWSVIAPSIAAPLLTWWWLVRPRGVWVQTISDERVILTIPNERAALAYRAKFGGSAANKPLPRTRGLEERVERTTLAPDRSLCAVHPSTQAPWTCGRCGSFFCPVCARYPIPGKNPVCSKCADAR